MAEEIFCCAVVCFTGWFLWAEEDRYDAIRHGFTLVPCMISLFLLAWSQLLQRLWRGSFFDNELKRISADVYTFIGLPLVLVHQVNVTINLLLSLMGIDEPKILLVENEGRSDIGYVLVVFLNSMTMLAMPTCKRCLVVFRPKFPIIVTFVLFVGVVIDRVISSPKHVGGASWGGDLGFLGCLGVQTVLICLVLTFTSWYAKVCRRVLRANSSPEAEVDISDEDTWTTDSSTNTSDKYSDDVQLIFAEYSPKKDFMLAIPEAKEKSDIMDA